MERLTDCAQGYCEMYCKKYGYCFEEPGDCIFKDEIKLYEAVKSIEGIVPFDRLLELADADRAGKLVVLPCKVGDTVFDIGDGTAYATRVLNFSYLGDHWACRTVSSYPDLEQFGTRIFLTREEAEAALAEKGGEG